MYIKDNIDSIHNAITNTSYVDCVDIIINLMENNKTNIQMINKFRNSRNIIEYRTRDIYTQMVVINSFFNDELRFINHNTLDTRARLVSDGVLNDWVHFYRIEIIPFITKHYKP